MQIEKSKLFQIEFYTTKPHWTTDYYDVFSGCKDSFSDYQKQVLGTPVLTVMGTFEPIDYERVVFQFNFLNKKILPYEIAYVKVIDINNVLQGKNFKTIYYFVTSFNFESNNIVRVQGLVDYWMTFWPCFEFNGNSLLVQRKHFPRYRTDKEHVGEYDFSTNSPMVNIDNIETTFTNIVTTDTINLVAKSKEQHLVTPISTANDYAYVFVLPTPDDSVGWIKDGKLNWTKVKDITDSKLSNDNFKLLELLNIDSEKNNKPQGCPWFVFAISRGTDATDIDVKSIIDNTKLQRFTFTTYDYKVMTYLGNKRIASLQIFDHPIMDINFDGRPYTDRLLYINGVSDYTDNKWVLYKEITGLSSNGNGFNLTGWNYILQGKDLVYYKPLKEYSENDALSLDQEPALFRTPHFEFEYVIYSCKGYYKIQNELLLSEGWNKDYGILYCDYVLHLNTHLKYIYANVGWYKYQYRMWKFGLFEENIYTFDLLTEPYNDFMQQNMYRFNTSVNQNWWNMGIGIAEGIGGLALAPFTGGLSLGASALGGLTIANSVKSGIFSYQQYQAQLKDLQRTPTTVMNQSNSFSNNAVKQMCPAGIIGGIKGVVGIRQHRDNERWILFWHFHQHGYLVSKRMEITDRNWFYSRTWFDFFILEDFSNVINQTNYSQMLMNKFNNLFKRGIRLWHTIDNFLNYEKNNKEIPTWKEVYLKK